MSQPPLNCPHSSLNAPGSPGALTSSFGDTGAELFWQRAFAQVSSAGLAISQGNHFAARATLSDVLLASTNNLDGDPVAGFACSLGVAAVYRLLALAYCTDSRLVRGTWPFRRAYQIALRFQHLANVWVTHVWEKFARREDAPGTGMAWYDKTYIDDSAWPISIQEINVEMTVVQNTLADEGFSGGHKPRWAKAPHDFRDSRLKIGIVSLCAYPPEHVLSRYATSNHQIYATRHGYRYHVARELVDHTRPPAWGKVKLMYQALGEPGVDWWLWFDCDTYFMNMTVTLDSLLFRYAAVESSDANKVLEAGLDPTIHMLVAEDNAMLNTGAFFLRSSEWSKELLRNAWGPDQSSWTDHPWWENAAILWNLLKVNSEKFRGEDHVKVFEGMRSENPQKGSNDPDELEGIYPAEVRLAPQGEFNSYHPATSHFMHDTWETGKFVLSFNGVLSNTSPSVIGVLYSNYYALSCELNNLGNQCVTVEDLFPW